MLLLDLIRIRGGRTEEERERGEWQKCFEFIPSHTKIATKQKDFKMIEVPLTQKQQGLTEQRRSDWVRCNSIL
jgi:hypothetical protein